MNNFLLGQNFLAGCAAIDIQDLSVSATKPQVSGTKSGCQCCIEFTEGQSTGIQISGSAGAAGQNGSVQTKLDGARWARLDRHCEWPECGPSKAYEALVLKKVPGASCLLADTLILTVGSDLVPIKDLRFGDLVVGAQGAVHKVRAVVPSFLGDRSLVGVLGQEPFFTPEHMLRSADGQPIVLDRDGLQRERPLLDMREIGDLLIGTKLLAPDGPQVVGDVTDILYKDAPADTLVYDLVLDTFDATYFANGIPCACFFPDVSANAAFFLQLSELAVEFVNVLPSLSDFELRPLAYQIAHILVSANADRLNAALFGPKIELLSFPEEVCAGQIPVAMFWLYMATASIVRASPTAGASMMCASKAATVAS